MAVARHELDWWAACKYKKAVEDLFLYVKEVESSSCRPKPGSLPNVFPLWPVASDLLENMRDDLECVTESCILAGRARERGSDSFPFISFSIRNLVFSMCFTRKGTSAIQIR